MKVGYSTSSTLRQWGGAAAVLGGALLGVWGYLHGNIVLSSSHMLAAAMDLLIDMLLLVGLVGLCAWWREGRTGWLETVGFVFGFAGGALSVAQGIHAFITASGLAEPAPWYVYIRAASGLPAYVFRWLPMLPIGMIIVGMGAIRVGELRGWGILLLTMGLSSVAYHVTNSGGVFGTGLAHVLFGAVYSLSWLVLGCLLWTAGNGRNAHTSQQ
jgi:hypothetical protein